MTLVSGTQVSDRYSEHPKERMDAIRNNPNRRLVRYQGSASPVPEQIRDQGDYMKFFRMYKDVFIPYAGADNYTSHSLLYFLLSLSEVSPTKCSVIESKKVFSLSGAIDIQRLEDPDFKSLVEYGEF